MQRRGWLIEPDVDRYPVDAIAAKVRTALDEYGSAVVIAPPGTGKTTRLPLLPASADTNDRLIVTEPRRVATRAAASRMASTLGERVGETVGYRMRDETRVGPRTRVEVVTEGVFVRMLQHDPGLDGVSTVLFDEVHERSLDVDLSFTLALDARAVLRPDLRVVVMSATLEAERVATLLGAPVLAPTAMVASASLAALDLADGLEKPRPTGAPLTGRTPRRGHIGPRTFLVDRVFSRAVRPSRSIPTPLMARGSAWMRLVLAAPA